MSSSVTIPSEQAADPRANSFQNQDQLARQNQEPQPSWQRHRKHRDMQRDGSARSPFSISKQHQIVRTPSKLFGPKGTLHTA